MTTRQSNIIFYGVIAMVIYGLIVNHFYPEFFENLTKSDQEISVKEAVAEGRHQDALVIYKQLAEKKVSDGDEVTIETADMYDAMAKSFHQVGNLAEEKNYYLKSLTIKKQIKNINLYSLADTYFELGTIAEQGKQYDEAISYYEQALSTRLGKTQTGGDEGIFEGLQNAQQRYKRLNNEGTITMLKRLASVHTVLKEYDTAKQYLEKALAASNLTFGEDDTKTIEIRDLLRSI